MSSSASVCWCCFCVIKSPTDRPAIAGLKCFFFIPLLSVGGPFLDKIECATKNYAAKWSFCFGNAAATALPTAATAAFFLAKLTLASLWMAVCVCVCEWALKRPGVCVCWSLLCVCQGYAKNLYRTFAHFDLLCCGAQGEMHFLGTMPQSRQWFLRNDFWFVLSLVFQLLSYIAWILYKIWF